MAEFGLSPAYYEAIILEERARRERGNEQAQQLRARIVMVLGREPDDVDSVQEDRERNQPIVTTRDYQD